MACGRLCPGCCGCFKIRTFPIYAHPVSTPLGWLKALEQQLYWSQLAGRWTGWLEVDGIRHPWTGAYGNRDRSWGPRRWGGPKMWRWFSINLGEEMHFGGIRLGTDAGDLHRGWVWDGTRATSIAEWRLRTELADDGVTQEVVHLQVADKEARTYDLRGDVLRVADIGRPGGTMVNEGLARWTYQAPGGGELTGYGICEYLHQLDDSGKPVVGVE